ncbi:MAG: 2OG-Fe(II) oxygenase, partial [Myxococcaceae bacterium]|nr:2OG-Fe(II) oxygenase [Myxococcaceae bacterium]
MKRVLEERFVVLLDDVLSATECDALVQRIDGLSPAAAPITTARGFELRPDVRNNERVMFDDVALAADLFSRLAAVCPSRLPKR